MPRIRHAGSTGTSHEYLGTQRIALARWIGRAAPAPRWRREVDAAVRRRHTRGKRLGHRSADSLPQPEHPPVSAETAKDRCPVLPLDPVVGPVNRHEWTGLDMTVTYPPTESQGYRNCLLLTASRLAGRSSRCAVEMTWGSYPRPMPDTYRLAQISETPQRCRATLLEVPPPIEEVQQLSCHAFHTNASMGEHSVGVGIERDERVEARAPRGAGIRKKNERSRDPPLSGCQSCAVVIKRFNSGVESGSTSRSGRG